MENSDTILWKKKKKKERTLLEAEVFLPIHKLRVAVHLPKWCWRQKIVNYESAASAAHTVEYSRAQAMHRSAGMPNDWKRLIFMIIMQKMIINSY